MDELDDKTRVDFEKMRAETARLLDALQKLEGSEEWGTLKELVYDRALLAKENAILSEAMKIPLNIPKLHFLQGEMSIIKRFCDVTRFADFHKSLLEDLNDKLK